MRDTNPTGLDAYKPAQIEQMVETVGVAKARLPLDRMFVLAVLAGVFIAFGAAAYTVTMTGTEPGFGPARVFGGVVFSVGLILVIIAGAELFTGNALMVIALVDRLITAQELTRNWVLVYLGNFVGALGIAIAEGKAALGWVEALMRGVLCNMLVCLAVWLTLAAHTVTGKIMAILWPITAFVALGFEHSIANMYLIPQGMFAGADVSVAAFLNNLFFVTIGNIIGGAGGVALIYRLAWGPPPNA